MKIIELLNWMTKVFIKLKLVERQKHQNNHIQIIQNSINNERIMLNIDDGNNNYSKWPWAWLSLMAQWRRRPRQR